MDKKLVTPKTKPPSQTEDSSSASASASSASASASASALSSSFYNCCLVNWYQPEHSIGLHSDDESEMDSEVPILSLSWGGPRRFLLRPKPKILETNNNQANSKVHELLLQSGDLVIMGGKCQEEFKHEVPKLRKMDGLVDNRISWTIRRMKKKSDDRKRKR
jgi:alkylated DNA repair dioxygenase AlkB